MSPPLIVLRPDDAARVAALHAAAMANPWPVQEFRRMLAGPVHLGLGIVDERNDSLTGFALCQHVLETSDLLMITVHPGARRRGYARTLLRALLRRLGERGAQTLTLDVAADNVPAIGLYRALGFEQIGERPEYYERGDTKIDALVMARPVAGLPSAEQA